MKGGIYSDDKCPVCGSRFKDTGKDLSCPNHPDIKTTALKVKFGDLCHRTDSYVEASRTLNGWRFKTDDEQSRELYQETLPKRSENVIPFDPALTLKNGGKNDG